MGGFGSRFVEAGYTKNKPCIPTYDRHIDATSNMVVASMRDIPGIFDEDTKIICVNRQFHADDGTEEAIKEVFPKTIFIHDHVLLDQAVACFLAREFLNSDEELFVGVCDSGMEINIPKFEKCKKSADAIMISHKGDINIARQPNAHSWAELDSNGEYLTRISVKKVLSEEYMSDHATTGMFWFKNARQFLRLLETMLSAEGSLLQRHVLDKILQYAIDANLLVTYLDVRYLCWGTPVDYEEYQMISEYWSGFVNENDW